MSFHRNADGSFLQILAKRTRKSITLDTKMLVIGRIEAGETRANVCSSLDLAPATVSTIMANAEKIKESAKKTAKLHASNVSYTRSPVMMKMEHLLALWVNDLNKRGIPLTQGVIASKAKSLFDDIQKEEGGSETFAASKGWFARFKRRSNIRYIRLNGETSNADNEITYELSNEESDTQNLTEQIVKNDKDKSKVKTILTKDLCEILSTIDDAIQHLCDVDPDKGRAFTVKRGIDAMLHPYYVIMQERREEISQLALQYFTNTGQQIGG